MNYWQVAAGDDTRDFSYEFLKYGVILTGSGVRFSFLERPDLFTGKKNWQKNVVTLAKKMKPGDVAILKKGRGRILAAGRVTGPCEYLERFDDVEGWDMRHGRRVNWVTSDSPRQVTGLTGSAISKVPENSHLREKADGLLKEGKGFPAENIPPPARDMRLDELVDDLTRNRTETLNGETLLQTIEHIRGLAKWYLRQRNQITEREICTFLIIPLLQALGWSERRTKLEWRIKGKRADVSLFNEEFKKDAKPCVVLEAKRIGVGLDRAEQQIRKYADDCNMVVTSTGDRYWLYTKDPGCEWDAGAMKEKHLRAYMNLLFLRDRHPYLEDVGGAPELLQNLMPG